MFKIKAERIKKRLFLSISKSSSFLYTLQGYGRLKVQQNSKNYSIGHSLQRPQCLTFFLTIHGMECRLCLVCGHQIKILSLARCRGAMCLVSERGNLWNKWPILQNKDQRGNKYKFSCYHSVASWLSLHYKYLCTRWDRRNRWIFSLLCSGFWALPRLLAPCLKTTTMFIALDSMWLHHTSSFNNYRRCWLHRSHKTVYISAVQLPFGPGQTVCGSVQQR